MLKNWKSTVLGFLPFLVAILNQFGVIDIIPEEADAAVGGVFDSLVMLLSSFVMLIGLVSKDADKSSKKLGLK